MAQKALKQTSRRNTAILYNLHIASLIINTLFILLRLIVFRNSTSRSTIVCYALFNGPALLLEFWLEKIGRPSESSGAGATKIRSGEDLEARGLTEYAFDVVYWTWGCLIVVSLFGEKAWWLWAVIPAFGGYKGVTLFLSMKQGMGDLIPGAGPEQEAQADSRRQKKLEKRGGQKVVYR